MRIRKKKKPNADANYWIQTNIKVAVILKWKLRQWSVRLKWQKKNTTTDHNPQRKWYVVEIEYRPFFFLLLGCRVVIKERMSIRRWRINQMNRWNIYEWEKTTFKSVLIKSNVNFYLIREAFGNRLGMKQLDYGCQLPGVTQLFLLIFIVLLIEIEFSPHEIILFLSCGQEKCHMNVSNLFEFYWFLIYACLDMRLANDLR